MKLVGKVKDAHGLRGELFVLIFSGDISWSEDLEVFQLKDGLGQTQEFKVKKIKPHKKGIIISSPDIQDRTHAEKLIGHHFLVAEDLLVSKQGETIFLSEILNFSLVDEKNQVLGKISGFSSNGMQDLLIIKNQRGEHLVPFVQPWIKNLDFENQCVQMDLPPGLLGEE